MRKIWTLMGFPEVQALERKLLTDVALNTKYGSPVPA